VDIGSPIDWLIAPDGDKQWQSHLGYFYFANCLVTAYRASGRRAYLDKWMSVLHDFFAFHPLGVEGLTWSRTAPMYRNELAYGCGGEGRFPEYAGGSWLGLSCGRVLLWLSSLAELGNDAAMPDAFLANLLTSIMRDHATVMLNNPRRYTPNQFSTSPSRWRRSGSSSRSQYFAGLLPRGHRAARDLHADLGARGRHGHGAVLQLQHRASGPVLRAPPALRRQAHAPHRRAPRDRGKAMPLPRRGRDAPREVARARQDARERRRRATRGVGRSCTVWTTPRRPAPSTFPTAGTTCSGAAPAAWLRTSSSRQAGSPSATCTRTRTPSCSRRTAETSWWTPELQLCRRPESWRRNRYFFSSMSHNTVTVDGLSQGRLGVAGLRRSRAPQNARSRPGSTTRHLGRGGGVLPRGVHPPRRRLHRRTRRSASRARTSAGSSGSSRTCGW